ncbi:hypothetical protein LP7551_02094 [Roseibium album]|nr:hypothetical protein LP7551_02094 [Roseibium album]
MTAGIQNSNSSYFVLKRALEEFSEHHNDMPPEDKLEHVEILLDSVSKCLASLTAQVRFYESAKGVGRALLVENDDGSHDHISGQLVEALRLPLPNLQEDAVIYGRPDALRAVSTALGAQNWPATGPAPIHDLALKLSSQPSDQQANSANAPPPEKAEVT